MAYDISTISLNVSLGNTKDVENSFNALVKTLETKKIKLEVDTSSIKASLSVMSSEIEQMYKRDTVAKQASENEKLRVMKQSNAQAMAYLKQQQAEIQKTYGVDSKLTFNQNPDTKQITSAMISFTNEIGKAETKMYKLNEDIISFVSSGEKIKSIKLSPVNETITSDLVKVNAELNKVIVGSQKVSDTMANKMSKITLGNEWIKSLESFKSLKVMIDAFDPTSVKMLKTDSYDLAQAWELVQQEIDRVNLGDKLSSEINKAQVTLDKFKASMGTKITGIEIGSNGDWAIDLTQYEQLKTKMNELNSITVTGTNLDLVASKISEVNGLYEKTSTEITRINQLNAEMNSKNAFNQNVTNSVSKYNTQLDSLISKNSTLASNPAMQKIREDVEKLNQTPPTEFNNACKQVENSISQLKTQMVSTTSVGTKMFGSLGDTLKGAFSFMSGSAAVYGLANAIRQIPSAVKEVDTAFVELQKVSEVTADQFDDIIDNAYKKGNELSATLTDYMGAMAAINRGGYTSDEDINALSKLSIIMKNVSENMKDTDNNATALISTLKGFNGSAAIDADHYVNSFNNISNNMAVTFDQLVDGSQRISAIMNTYKNSFDETVAMITSGTEVFGGDAERVSTGIKTIAMNLAGITQEGEKANPEYLAKLSDELNSLAGIDITDTNGQLKSTFDILSELADVYPTLNTNQKAYMTQLIGKKTQAPVLAAILQNWEAVKKAQELSINSAGSYADEQSKYYESIQGYTDRLVASFQKLSVSTLDGGLVKQILELTTNFITLIDTVGGLTPVLAGVVLSMTALKVISASEALSFAGMSKGAKSLVTSLFAVKATTDATTASTVALSMAQKLLIGGAIIAGVMAIAGAITYFAKESERAKEKVENLKNEIADIKSVSSSLEGLGKEFESLSKKAELNTDETKRLYDVQNQIKELQPAISGYYDEQGNFIITQVTTAQELLEIQKESLRIKKEELLLASQNVIDDEVEKYDKLKQQMADVVRYNELLSQGEMSSNDVMEAQEISARIGYVDTSNMDGAIKDIKSKMEGASKEIHDYLIYSLDVTDEWNGLSVAMKNGIRKTLAEMDAEELKSFAEKLKSGGTSVNEFIGEMSKISTPIESIAPKLDGITDSTGSAESGIKSLSERMSEAADKTDILKVALKELESNQDISSSTMDKLVKKYPELEEGMTDVSSAIDLINKKILEQNFDEATNNIADLTSILSDLEKGSGITAASFKKISKNFPELLGYMDDEKTLIDAVISKTEEYKNKQTTAYNEMLMATESYYKSKMLADTNWVQSTQNNLNGLINSMGSGYKVDLSNYSNNEQAKIKITSTLVKELSGIWASYFGKIAEGMSLGQLEEENYIDGDESRGSNVNYEAYNKAKKLHDAIQKMGDSFKDLKIPDIKVGGAKSANSKKDKSSQYIKSLYDSILNSLQEGTDKVDRQIAISQSKLENLELFGKQEDITKATSDLEKLYQDRVDIMKKSSEQMVHLRNKMAKELQATGYEEIKGLDLANISQLGVDKIINKLEKQIDSANKSSNSKLEASLTYKKNLIEDYTGTIINANSEINSMAKSVIDAQNKLADTVIDNIKRVIELDKQRYDDKLKQIEIEQFLLDEDSDAYKAKEQDKINMITDLQKGYQETIRQLKAKGLSDESDDVREYLSMWKNAEMERLNLIKARGNAEKEAQLKTSKDKVDDLKKQKDAIEELTDLTLAMIKKEAQAKKKAIQDEIDGYKAIINAKKESLREEQDNKNYQAGLTEKEKAIKSLEDELLALSGDNSEKANFQKLQLEEKLQKAREELEKYQYDNSIDMREKALDKELEAFEKEKQEEIDVIDDMLSKEGNLRKQALAMIEKGNKDLYNKLIKYNDEYGNGISTTIVSAWETAQEAISEYGGSQESLLITLRNISLEMERQSQLQQQISASSWRDYVSAEDLTPTTQTTPSGSNSNISGTNINNQSNGGLSQKGKEQLNQQKYLHDQMLIAKETSNKQLEAWVKSERKKWDLDPNTGKILKQRHDGILSGRLDGLKPSELILRATEKEWVLTNPQMTNIENNLKNLQLNNSQQPLQPISLTFDNLINVEGNLDKTVDINSITKHVTAELVNTLSLAGLVPKRR